MPDSVIEMAYKDRIAVVTLNRPDRRNSLNRDVLEELARIADDLTKTPPRAVILTGKGDKAFSAGFDVNLDNPMAFEIFEAISSNNMEKAKGVVNSLREAVDAFIAIPAPLIAAVNGNAYGAGAEIAARCDMRVVGRSAAFCFSEVTLGLMPDFGGGSKLAKLIGPSRAADLILTARKVTADEALFLGLADRVCDDGDVLEHALALAGKIAQNGPRAVRHSLSVIRRSMDQTLDESLDFEKEQAVSLILSGECIHGVAAFLEKRAPDFPDAG
jgi:enoyl-CoA hydratase